MAEIRFLQPESHNNNQRVIMRASKSCSRTTKEKVGYITTNSVVPDNFIENIPQNESLSSFDTYWVVNLDNSEEERNTKQRIKFARLYI